MTKTRSLLRSTNCETTAPVAMRNWQAMRLPYNGRTKQTPNVRMRKRNCRATAPVAVRNWQAMRLPYKGRSDVAVGSFRCPRTRRLWRQPKGNPATHQRGVTEDVRRYVKENAIEDAIFHGKSRFLARDPLSPNGCHHQLDSFCWTIRSSQAPKLIFSWRLGMSFLSTSSVTHASS